jgi:hypothetical protein
MANKLGRDGKVAKNFIGADIPAHSGMRFRAAVDGQTFLATGISKTELGHMTESGGTPITDPTVEKRIGGQPPVYPGHIRTAFGAAKPGDAHAILTDPARFGYGLDVRDVSAPGATKGRK